MAAQGITAALLAANSISDLRRKEILLLPTLLAWAAGIVAALRAPGGIIPLLLSLLPGLCLMGISAASGGRIGMGDALVVCAAGTWTGAGRVCFSLFAALMSVPAAALLLRKRGRRIKEMPFIPFLCAGYLVSLLLFSAS